MSYRCLLSWQLVMISGLLVAGIKSLRISNCATIEAELFFFYFFLVLRTSIAA